jgi:hypothetical protein
MREPVGQVSHHEFLSGRPGRGTSRKSRAEAAPVRIGSPMAAPDQQLALHLEMSLLTLRRRLADG